MLRKWCLSSGQRCQSRTTDTGRTIFNYYCAPYIFRSRNPLPLIIRSPSCLQTGRLHRKLTNLLGKKSYFSLILTYPIQILLCSPRLCQFETTSTIRISEEETNDYDYYKLLFKSEVKKRS
jgi:hypothetical protein